MNARLNENIDCFSDDESLNTITNTTLWTQQRLYEWILPYKMPIKLGLYLPKLSWQAHQLHQVAQLSSTELTIKLVLNVHTSNLYLSPSINISGNGLHIHIFLKLESLLHLYLFKESQHSFLPVAGFLEEIPAFLPFPFQAIIVPCSSFQIGSSVMISLKHEVSREKACNSVALCDIFIMLQNFEISYPVIPRYFHLERNWFY